MKFFFLTVGVAFVNTKRPICFNLRVVWQFTVYTLIWLPNPLLTHISLCNFISNDFDSSQRG